MLKQMFATLLMGLAAFTVPAAATAQKTLFYMTTEGPSERDFMEHRAKIDIIVPTWYGVDEDGLVYGEPSMPILKAAKESHVSIVPIVALFDKDKVHKLLGNDRAQAEMIAALIRECKRNGYDGFQFDLEDILWTDRDALSALVQKTADALHAQHLQLQIAVVPNAPGYPGHTPFGKWIFEEWRGAFDLQALGKAVDLLCLMTYDQHTRWTVPGPVGGWGLDGDEYAVRAGACAGEQAVARDCLVRVPLVHRRPRPGQGEEGATPDGGTTLARPTPGSYATTLAATKSGTRWTTRRGSSSIATRCASGCFIPTSAGMTIAGSWRSRTTWPAPAPGCWARKRPRSGRCCRSISSAFIDVSIGPPCCRSRRASRA